MNVPGINGFPITNRELLMQIKEMGKFLIKERLRVSNGMPIPLALIIIIFSLFLLYISVAEHGIQLYDQSLLREECSNVVVINQDSEQKMFTDGM